MRSLLRALFGSDTQLQEDAAQLVVPTDLETVLARHRAGEDPPPSNQQGVVLFYSGHAPVRSTILVPGTTNAESARTTEVSASG